VGLAVVVRVIQHAQTDREIPAERRKDERGGESHGSDYEKRVHGGYLRGGSQPELRYLRN
jgi:hypothetical protein